MGKNGDQIQRLVFSPGEAVIIQYHGQVGDYVREQLEKLAQGRSTLEQRPLWYGIIDGQDTRRLIAAYPSAFGIKKK